MEVEWIVSKHASRRALERHGTAFDPACFTPQPWGLDGLRLWLDAAGNGVLVREDHGTGWQQFTVVTAYSPGYVRAARERDRKPLVRMPLALHSRRAVARARTRLTSELFQVLEMFYFSSGFPDARAVAGALHLSLDQASAAIGQLYGRGLIERVSKKARTWKVTELGRKEVQP